MAGAIDKKKNDTVTELEGSPAIHIDTRAGILKDIGLSREFAQTYLQGLCQEFTGGKNEANQSVGMSLHTVCQVLAKQRMLCYGARTLATSSNTAGFRSFDLPAFKVVNGALGLTEANTSKFGIVATDLSETNRITLTSGAGTQTIDGNTFSTRASDYYLSRSRISGELEDISANTKAYTTPDGADVVFGNAIAWGSSVAGEQSANTWNYHWARANVSTVATHNSGTVFQLEAMTLADHLTQGSNTDYTPLGPAMGGKYYLKKHADSVNNFTITGTTITGNVEITSISDADIAKIKYGDLISGTGIPTNSSGTFANIGAVQSADSKIRISDVVYTTGTVGQAANVVTLSGGTWPTYANGGVLTITGGGGNVISRDSDTQVTLDNSATVSTGTGQSLSYSGRASANGTITISVNSVPFGHAAHDIFCQIEISAEGLVANTTWLPVGNLTGGGLTNATADALCDANTTQFIGLLGFFDPAQSSSEDLIKGGSGLYASEGKEYNGAYPNIEINPFEPANGGTTKAYEVKETEIVGAQPTNLSDKDVFIGRHVSWNKDRANAAGAVTEFRYIVDSAERFFYAPARNLGYSTGNDTVAAEAAMPNAVTNGSEVEHRAVMPRKGLTALKTRMIGTSAKIGSTTITSSATSTVPQDSDYTYQAQSAITSQPSNPVALYYKKETNGGCVNIITQWEVDVTYENTGNSTVDVHTHAYSTALVGPLICKYNFVQQHIYGTADTGSSAPIGANPSLDATEIALVIDAVQATDAFRDPILYNVTDPVSYDNKIAGGGISDLDFDTKADNLETDLNAVKQGLADYAAKFAAQTRGPWNSTGTSIPNPNPPARGTALDFDSFTHGANSHNGTTEWNSFVTDMTNFATAAAERVVEIDARMGVPTYAGSVSSRGTAPAVRVSVIPSSNTTSGHVPYCRTLYNNVNHLLGQDINLLGGIVKDIESLTDLIGLVKTARNKYELYSGRDKVVGY